MATKLEGKIKIVTPSWIIDSIKADKLLDEGHYVPYEPKPEEKDTTTSGNQDSVDKESVAMETTLQSGEINKLKGGASEKKVESEEKMEDTAEKNAVDGEQKPVSDSKAIEVTQKISESLTTEKPEATATSPRQPSVSKEDIVGSKDVIEVRETPVKTTGQSTDIDKLESVSATRHEECLDRENDIVIENGDKTKTDTGTDVMLEDEDIAVKNENCKLKEIKKIKTFYIRN